MKRTVLLTNVERRTGRELRAKLLMQNYEVFTAGSIQEAFDHFDLVAIDLALVDLDVPAPLGAGAVHRLARLNPAIRVIGLTERSDLREEDIAVRLNGVAEKPVDLRNLLNVIEAMLAEGHRLTGFCYVPPKTTRCRNRLLSWPHPVPSFRSARESIVNNHFKTGIMRKNLKRKSGGDSSRTQRVKIEFSHPTANAIAIAGTFNDWRPEASPMVALGDGRWRKDMVLPRGRHEYLLVVDGRWMPDPSASETVPNPYGSVNSILNVADLSEVNNGKEPSRNDGGDSKT